MCIRDRLSRTRTRLSASSLTKYLRCPKQFFLGNKLGLSSPKSIYQVLGIVLEDSICSLLMRRPVSINSLEGLREWCYNLADEEAKHCFQLGKENWDSTIWQNAEQSWEDVAVEELARKIKNIMTPACPNSIGDNNLDNQILVNKIIINEPKRPSKLQMVPLTIFFFNFAKKELIAPEDRGAFFVIVKAPQGSGFNFTKDRAEEIEELLLPSVGKGEYRKLIMRVPGFGSSANSYNSFIIIALLDHWKNRDQDSQTVMRQAIGKIVTVPQAVAFPISPQSIRVSSYNKPVQMVIYGSTYEELEELQKKIIRELRSNKNLSRIESDYNRNKPEVKLIINKNKAKDLGVSTKSIGETLETLYGGKKITTFNKLGKEYPIIVQQYLSDRRNKEGVSKIFVRSETNGKLISLANLVSFKEEGSAKELSRYNRQRAITISANVNEGYTLTEAIKYFEEVMSNLAPENQITWKGKSEEIKETSNELFIIFALALLTAYLVMAATFNSFIHPFIIILTVPLAIFGGLIFILFLNSSVNIFSQIALIILIGISTKNSILIVDWANQLRVKLSLIHI